MGGSTGSFHNQIGLIYYRANPKSTKLPRPLPFDPHPPRTDREYGKTRPVRNHVTRRDSARDRARCPRLEPAQRRPARRPSTRRREARFHGWRGKEAERRG